MPLFFADLVRETSFGVGAGPLPLAGALPGHRRFADVVPGGASFLYCIAGVTHPAEWETGEGEIVDGLLVRTAVASPAGGAAVAFSPGLKTVALTATAAWFESQEAGGGPVSIGDVDGLAAALAGKAAASHDHAGVYQPLDGELSALAGLSSAADRLPYFTGAGSAALATFTAAGRALVDDTDAAAQRATLGLGSIATQAAGAVAITGGTISGIADLGIADGGTGASSAAAAATNLGLGAASSVVFANLDIGAGGRIVTPGLRVEGGAPGLNIKDTDSAGAAITGSFGFLDSGNNQVARVGRPFGDGNLWIENDGGSIYFGTAIGSGGAQLSASAFDLLGGRVLRVGGTQVAGARIGGWGSPTGSAARGGFDTASVTLAALAERVKALIDDLKTHGLIGS